MIGGMRLYRIAIACCTLALLAACGRSHVTREPAANASAGERPVRVSQPKYGATVVVQRGQNVYRIATENGLTALDLALWNDIPPPGTARRRPAPWEAVRTDTHPRRPPQRRSRP